MNITRQVLEIVLMSDLPVEDLDSRRKVAKGTLNVFCSITMPSDADPSLLLDSIGKRDRNEYLVPEVDSKRGARGAVSRKPGNIVLNWKKLFGEFPAMALTVAGAFTGPEIFVLSALVVAKSVWSLAQIEVSEHHALTLFKIWEETGGKTQIGEATAFKIVNKHLSASGRNILTKAAFAQIIDDLCDMKSITLTDGMISAVEKVSKEYNDLSFLSPLQR